MSTNPIHLQSEEGTTTSVVQLPVFQTPTWAGTTGLRFVYCWWFNSSDAWKINSMAQINFKSCFWNTYGIKCFLVFFGVGWTFHNHSLIDDITPCNKTAGVHEACLSADIYNMWVWWVAEWEYANKINATVPPSKKTCQPQSAIQKTSCSYCSQEICLIFAPWNLMLRQAVCKRTFCWKRGEWCGRKQI